MNEASALTELKGVGEKTVRLFERIGVTNIGELLHYFPRDYENYEEIQPINQTVEGTKTAVYASLEKMLSVQRAGRMQIVSGKLKDESGSIRVTWYNMPYLRNTLRPDVPHVFRGRIVRKRHQMIMEQPAVFSLDAYLEMQNRWKPVYALTDGLTGNAIAKAVRQALDKVTLSKEFLPMEVRKRYRLAEYNFALEQIHFPEDMDQFYLARRRLVFDEFFVFILALRRLKTAHERVEQSFHMKRKPHMNRVIENLGFKLTNAQQKVWKEIEEDMTGKFVMSRLIQGDVGSGKTILAFLALFLAAENDCQGCLMVPTEVLAAQHFEAAVELVEKQELPYRIVLLTGSMTARQKRDIYERIRSGQADIVIGTHAVFQEKVEYLKLGLVITDEQHRFGVRQREALAEKGGMPHVMVMSATPIPRTLAVILYGDLDISVIDELPANRLPVKNCVVDTTFRSKAYHFIEGQVRNGHQAYVICPMVEESERIEAENVVSYAEKLRKALSPDICVEYLHGKMKPSEKNAIMERFVKQQIQVLVSTTVIEVGVNVPNATVMMIENAERFGLAQLHQLRGRVGRGCDQSYCIFCYGVDSEKTRQRLEILCKSNDGFFIAGEDLKLRGPGDLFGLRQSGILAFRIGDVFQDASILQEANEAANAVISDPEFPDSEKYQILERVLENYMYKDICNLNL